MKSFEDEFRKITIIGMGLLGGSIGMFIRRNYQELAVVGAGRSEERLSIAQKLDACSEITTDYEKAVQNSDLIILCTPVKICPQIYQIIHKHIKKNAIVTDVGSTKGFLVNRIEKMRQEGDNPNHCFIGSHPMAGSDRTGVKNSKPNLFKGKRVVITPSSDENKEQVSRLKSFWETLGSRVVLTNTQDHDYAVSLTSHLPHLISFAMIALLMEDSAADESASSKWLREKIYGTGLLDFTRIAKSDEIMWCDILLSNKEFILADVEKFKSCLDNLSEIVKNENYDELTSLLRGYKEFRQKLN